jgi:hypothetical protein
MRMAFSLASAPPFVKKNTSMSPGVISASFSPSRARASVAMNGIRVGERGRLVLDGLDDPRIPVARCSRTSTGC